jgi:RluA family pseudouridine synthase
MKKRLFTVAIGDPPTLAAAIAARLSLGADEVAAAIARGSVQLDGRRAGGDQPVRPGARVIVHLRSDSDITITTVYADEWIVVVDKPSGVPSQATRGEAATALDARVQAAHPGARLVHRLDRDASGLVLFSLDERARAPLQRALDAGQIERRYLAVVAGRLDGEGTIALRIARDPHDERRRRALPENDPNGQEARSRWRARSHAHNRTTLELTLETGRTHQLRVHLAAIGHPIVGDRLYGGPDAPRLHLHAHALALPHPRDGRPLSFSSPAPFSSM